MGSQVEIQVGSNMEENAESLDRLFFDGGVKEVNERVFWHGQAMPWVPLGNFSVATGVKHEKKNTRSDLHLSTNCKNPPGVMALDVVRS